MTIVCNSSPLINLACINQLDLLRRLYGEISIPQAVWREVVVQGAGQPGAEEVQRAQWTRLVQVVNVTLVQALRQELDAGEAEAIVLALELKAELLLMDEQLGRDIARHMGLRFTGLIGCLIEAKHKGLIMSIKPHLDALRSEANFRLSTTLYRRVLSDEREI
jgi:predicted nucleic acid-binding protein